jgi:hypothetical protein
MKFLEGKKTYIGIFIAAAPTVAGFFGYDLSVEGATELGGILGDMLTNIDGLVTLGGTLIAAYGRVVTKGA